MLTDFVDLALNGVVGMWILSLCYIVYTALTDRGRMDESSMPKSPISRWIHGTPSSEAHDVAINLSDLLITPAQDLPGDRIGPG